MGQMETIEMDEKNTMIEWLEEFRGNDLDELCNATEEAIIDGNGFGWLKPPQRQVLENYWRGVLLVPQRRLVVARLEGSIVGSSQFVTPAANNEAGAFSVEMTTFFLAPWARGHNLGSGMMSVMVDQARAEGFRTFEFNVRVTQAAGIRLAEQMDFQHWATKEKYALVDGEFIAGNYYIKDLDAKIGSEMAQE
jgi:L-amino acid N-acyltransferase YncA